MAVIASSLAAECSSLRLGAAADTSLACNAFDVHNGDLMIVPDRPRFTKMDFSEGTDTYPWCVPLTARPLTTLCRNSPPTHFLFRLLPSSCSSC